MARLALQGLLRSLQFLWHLLQLARETVQQLPRSDHRSVSGKKSGGKALGLNRSSNVRVRIFHANVESGFDAARGACVCDVLTGGLSRCSVHVVCGHTLKTILYPEDALCHVRLLHVILLLLLWSENMEWKRNIQYQYDDTIPPVTLVFLPPPRRAHRTISSLN